MKTHDALEIIDRRYFEGQPEEQAGLEEARLLVAIGELAYQLRESAGLSQQEIAQRVGVTAHDVEALEIADYEGDHLALVQRIAVSLGRRIVVDSIPAVPPTTVAA